MLNTCNLIICWPWGHDYLGDQMVRASDYFINEVFVFKNIDSIDQLVEEFSHFGFIDELFSAINFKIHDPNLLFNIFCHKSFSHENSYLNVPNNERLEFLGDSVLQLIISEALMIRYKDKKEGELSKLRSSIVNAETLSCLSQMLGLDKLILLGKGEYKECGFEKESLLADTFEALLGAVFLESGLSQCKVILLKVLQDYQDKFKRDILSDEILLEFDAKSRLQELVMKYFKVTPVYQSLEIKENKKTFFKVSLIIKKNIINTITHESKKKAMQILAKDAIKNKKYLLKGDS